MDQTSLNIRSLFTTYCKKHLDNDYLNLCNKVFEDLLKGDEKIFKRGKAEIWAASVVWSVGSINFLGDKSFEPYATLADVCSFFKVNTSTVGQKASKIKDLLDISIWDSRYQLADSSVGNFLDSLVMTKEGFIVPADMLDDDEIEEENQNSEEDVEVVEEDDYPVYYKIVFKANSKTSNAQIYQLEYLLKKMLTREDNFVNFKIINNIELHFIFNGWWETVEKIEEKVLSTDFSISGIYSADSIKAFD